MEQHLPFHVFNNMSFLQDMLSRHPDEGVYSRMRGTIYGNAIGDAIGLLTEFMEKPRAERVSERSNDFININVGCLFSAFRPQEDSKRLLAIFTCMFTSCFVQDETDYPCRHC